MLVKDLLKELRSGTIRLEMYTEDCPRSNGCRGSEGYWWGLAMTARTWWKPKLSIDIDDSVKLEQVAQQETLGYYKPW